jgi:hypothetical protein
MSISKRIALKNARLIDRKAESEKDRYIPVPHL